MTTNKIKEVMDACYQAKRVRDMLPTLPGEITSTHIHYLDTLRKLEETEGRVKVSAMSDFLGLPRPSVTKTIKDMKKLGLIEKETSEADGRLVFVKLTTEGKKIVDEYVDRYFSDLSKELEEITDEEADKLIEVVGKIYTVMRKRK